MLISELSIRGFKSYGNNEQILKLNTEKGELILLVGQNGAGKSSLLDSFDFVLYGKCKGKKKKWSTLSTLPNRINGELLNKIKFMSGGIEIEIERGISPNILKLNENGINNDRAGKVNLDEKIEKYIGVDIETFKSFISMSINDFKNFISLSNEEKQILLDKLFNLEVINILNGILKDINKSNKSLILRHETEISTLEDSVRSIQLSIQKAIEKEKEDIQGEIETIRELMNSKKDEFGSLKDKVEKIKLKEIELKTDLDKEKEQLSSIANEVRNIQKEIDLYNLGKCPTCKTSFEGEEFTSLLDILIEKKAATDKIKSEIEININSIKEKQYKLQEISNNTNKSYNDITYLLKNYKAQIDKLQTKMTFENSASNSIKEFENTITELNSKKVSSEERITLCREKEIYYKELNRIFSDEGVKKAIIAGIIKPINHFISENVKHMNLPFQVQLDESFNAEVKQFGLDVEHDTLSTGETRKLNLAILVAYLKLIRTKRHINILFLDEVFSSIDMEGIESILILLKEFAVSYNVNIFVVHHAIMNKEYFDRIIQVEKNVFSEIKELTYTE
jgi:DNA repair exonuclease SbcCD ATPase subunit